MYTNDSLHGVCFPTVIIGRRGVNKFRKTLWKQIEMSNYFDISATLLLKRIELVNDFGNFVKAKGGFKTISKTLSD